MQVLQHEIDSLSKINDMGSFFDKCLIPQDILDKANAMAAAEGFKFSIHSMNPIGVENIKSLMTGVVKEFS